MRTVDFLMYRVHGRKPSRRSPRRRSGRGPVRDHRYKAWIRTLPCAHCNSTHDVEAAHTGSDGGMRQKASDRSCVPLCHDCHQAHPVSYHRNRKMMDLDFPALVARLNEVYGGMIEYCRGQE